MSIEVGVHDDIALASSVRELALEGYQPPAGEHFESREKFIWLRELGSSLWLDTGDSAAADKVWSAEIEALTTNNTLVNQVVQTGAMDALVSYAVRKIRDARPDISDQDQIAEIAFLINARLALSLVQKFGARVSVELHPDSAFSIAKTLAFARRYYEINPDYFYVKVPLTPEGFVAVRQLSAEGIPVNYTLGFSARQNYLATRLSRPSFVNIFLGRLNAVVEENHLGSPENVGEKATLASDEIVKDIRRSQTDSPTRQIGASLRSGGQVVSLAGVDVLTIPPKAAGEYLELDIKKDAMTQLNWRDLKVDLDPGSRGAFAKLWEIDGQFIAFVDDAVRQGDGLKTGQDLVDLSRKHGVDLFHDWTEQERSAIREKGKIPNLSKWPSVAIDDLMSTSALETFATDQMALDNRIAELIKQA